MGYGFSSLDGHGSFHERHVASMIEMGRATDAHGALLPVAGDLDSLYELLTQYADMLLLQQVVL